jgi:hypothetical protein
VEVPNPPSHEEVNFQRTTRHYIPEDKPSERGSSSTIACGTPRTDGIYLFRIFTECVNKSPTGEMEFISIGLYDREVHIAQYTRHPSIHSNNVKTMLNNQHSVNYTSTVIRIEAQLRLHSCNLRSKSPHAAP